MHLAAARCARARSRPLRARGRPSAGRRRARRRERLGVRRPDRRGAARRHPWLGRAGGAVPAPGARGGRVARAPAVGAARPRRRRVGGPHAGGGRAHGGGAAPVERSEPSTRRRHSACRWCASSPPTYRGRSPPARTCSPWPTGLERELHLGLEFQAAAARLVGGLPSPETFVRLLALEPEVRRGDTAAERSLLAMMAVVFAATTARTADEVAGAGRDGLGRWAAPRRGPLGAPRPQGARDGDRADGRHGRHRAHRPPEPRDRGVRPPASRRHGRAARCCCTPTRWHSARRPGSGAAISAAPRPTPSRRWRCSPPTIRSSCRPSLSALTDVYIERGSPEAATALLRDSWPPGELPQTLSVSQALASRGRLALRMGDAARRARRPRGGRPASAGDRLREPDGPDVAQLRGTRRGPPRRAGPGARADRGGARDRAPLRRSRADRRSPPRAGAARPERGHGRPRPRGGRTCSPAPSSASPTPGR